MRSPPRHILLHNLLNRYMAAITHRIIRLAACNCTPTHDDCPNTSRSRSVTQVIIRICVWQLFIAPLSGLRATISSFYAYLPGVLLLIPAARDPLHCDRRCLPCSHSPGSSCLPPPAHHALATRRRGGVTPHTCIPVLAQPHRILLFSWTFSRPISLSPRAHAPSAPFLSSPWFGLVMCRVVYPYSPSSQCVRSPITISPPVFPASRFPGSTSPGRSSSRFGVRVRVRVCPPHEYRIVRCARASVRARQ